jgi:hypothetical protein
MKKLNLILLFLLISTLSFGQNRDFVETRLDSISKYYFGKRVSVISPMIGYDLSTKVLEGNDTTGRNHWLEIGIIKNIFTPIHRHGSGNIGYYFSNSIKLSTNNFVIAPKIGGMMTFAGFMFGSEFVYYTNFSQQLWRYRPFFGFGTEKFQLAFVPHVALSNNDRKGFSFALRLNLFDRNKYGYWRYRHNIDYRNSQN